MRIAVSCRPVVAQEAKHRAGGNCEVDVAEGPELVDCLLKPSATIASFLFISYLVR